MAVSGWYPDPAGTAQLRFWDGQSWTTATSAPPPVQAAFAPTAPPVAPQYTPQYAPQPVPNYAPQYSSKGGPERGRRFWSVVAGLVVTGAMIAAAIPLVSSSHHPPTNASLQRSLLTVGQLGAAADGTFTLQAPDNSDDNSDSSDDCQGTDPSKVVGPGGVKAEASQEYADSSQGIFVDEDLVYAPGKAAAFLETIEPELTACHSLTVDGGKLAVSLLPAPPVTGSDDTFAVQATGKISGITVSVDIEMTRFGDSIVTVTYGGRGEPEEISTSSAVVLTEAAIQAKHAF